MKSKFPFWLAILYLLSLGMASVTLADSESSLNTAGVQLPRMLIIKVTQQGATQKVEFQGVNCTQIVQSQQSAMQCNELAQQGQAQELNQTTAAPDSNVPNSVRELFDAHQAMATSPISMLTTFRYNHWHAYRWLSPNYGFYGYGYGPNYGYSPSHYYYYPNYGYYNSGYYYPYVYSPYYYNNGPYSYYYYYNPYYPW